MYREANARNNIILNHLYCKHTKQYSPWGKKMMQPINTAFEQLKAKFLENELECSYCYNVISLIRCAVYRKVSLETVLYTFTYNQYLNRYDD